MENIALKNKMATVAKLLEKIEGAAKIEFANLLPKEIDVAGGIYFIATNDNQILYVGKGSDLRRRIYTNQLQGNLTTARLKKYLIDDIDYPEIKTPKQAKDWIKKNCFFKILKEKDARRRALNENCLTYFLEPKYIDLVR